MQGSMTVSLGVWSEFSPKTSCGDVWKAALGASRLANMAWAMSVIIFQ